MSLIRNLFNHQKHHVRKVCISHESVNASDLNDVGNTHPDKKENDALLANGKKKGKHKKGNFTKRKGEKYTKVQSMDQIPKHNDGCVPNGGNFHSPNVLLESGSTVLEDLEDDNHNLPAEKLTEHAKRALAHDYYTAISENNNVRLVGTTHPSYLQTSMRSGKIRATCYCSDDIDQHFKPTPIHIFCAGTEVDAFPCGLGIQV